MFLKLTLFIPQVNEVKCPCEKVNRKAKALLYNFIYRRDGFKELPVVIKILGWKLGDVICYTYILIILILLGKTYIGFSRTC
jgi:hypothetical protein